MFSRCLFAAVVRTTQDYFVCWLYADQTSNACNQNHRTRVRIVWLQSRDSAHNYETDWPQTAYHSVANRPKSAETGGREVPLMLKFLLWCVLLVLCWPLALLALVLYPIIWLLLLPFRLVGIAVEGVFDLIRAILFLPARILRGPRTA